MLEPLPETRPRSEDWVSPFEDELDTPAFLRRRRGEDEEDPFHASARIAAGHADAAAEPACPYFAGNEVSNVFASTGASARCSLVSIR